MSLGPQLASPTSQSKQIGADLEQVGHALRHIDTSADSY